MNRWKRKSFVCCQQRDAFDRTSHLSPYHGRLIQHTDLRSSSSLSLVMVLKLVSIKVVSLRVESSSLLVNGILT